MTREEAIKILELETRQEALSPYLDRPMEKMLDAMIEASRMGASALRAQPAKLDRSRWKGCPDCKGEFFEKRRQYMRPVMEPLTPEQALMDKLTELTGIVYVKVKNEFCHTCGRPLTKEAWEELERRLGGNDGTANS